MKILICSLFLSGMAVGHCAPITIENIPIEKENAKKKITFDIYYGNPYALAPPYYSYFSRYSDYHHYPYHYNHPHRRQFWHHPYANYEFRYDW